MKSRRWSSTTNISAPGKITRTLPIAMLRLLILSLTTVVFGNAAIAQTAALCSGGCEAASRHEPLSCGVSLVPKGVTVSPPSETLQAELEMFFDNWDLQDPPLANCTTVVRGPALPLAINWTGGNSYSVFTAGRRVCRHIYTDEITEVRDGPFQFGGCSCAIDNSRDRGVGGTDRKCYCRPGQQFLPALDKCVPYINRYHEKPLTCESGRPRTPNPIDILSSAKLQVVELDNSLGFPLTLTYDTRQQLPSLSPDMRYSPVPPVSFGSMWHSNLNRRLINQSSPVRNIQAYRGSNSWVTFVADGSTYRADADTADSIFSTFAGTHYRDASGRSLETYTSSNDLASIKRADGSADLSLTYSDANTPVSIAPKPGLLIKIQDARGRTVQFVYEQPAGNVAPRVVSMTNASGGKTSFSYDSIGNLVRITWPDTTTRQFVYERSDLVWAMTGQIDEAGKRIGTYTYDTDGRATQSQGAGGVNSYSVTYEAPPVWTVTETYDSALNVIWRDHVLKAPTGTQLIGPGGEVTAIQSANVQNMPRLTAQSQPAGSGCGPASSSQEFDANANVIRRDDFTGQRTCAAYDMSRNLETSRVEGLAKPQACGTVTPANAALPPGSRKISTAWHPDWRMAVKIAEPRRLTTYVYNGQPDPFAGNAIASCAPASASMADYKPIAVLCKTVEQATYDAGGAAGFAAVLDTSVPNRVWTYTYNEFGQVLTSRDPRGNTTTNSYYATTTADYTRGDLEKTTGALPALVTRFTKYNPMGQVLQSIDANGVATDYEYDLRQRLTRQTTAGQSTVFEYLPTGQLKRVTQPDLSYVSYEYDPAQRLVAVADNLGNRIEYTLDNSGRQREERVKDPTGILKRQVSRVFDALGRTQQVTGRE